VSGSFSVTPLLMTPEEVEEDFRRLVASFADAEFDEILPPVSAHRQTSYPPEMPAASSTHSANRLTTLAVATGAKSEPPAARLNDKQQTEALKEHLPPVANPAAKCRQPLNPDNVPWRTLAAGLTYGGETFDSMFPRYGPGATLMDYLDRAICQGHGTTSRDPHRGKHRGISLRCETLAKCSKKMAAKQDDRISTSRRNLEHWRPILVEAELISPVGQDAKRRVLYTPAWHGAPDARAVLLRGLQRLVVMKAEGRLNRSRPAKSTGTPNQAYQAWRSCGDPVAIPES
jgi:hypothetical protein